MFHPSRRTRRARLLRGALALCLLGVACKPSPQAASETQAALPAVDHHVHLLSPELVREWKSLGVPFSRPDSAYTSVDAIFGARSDVQAFLVSMAHVYGSEEFRGALSLSVEGEHARVRRANDQVAHEVARAPDRFVGFCSVALLRPYAAAEIERCRSELALAGLKLHLPSSGVRLRDPHHRRLLVEIAARAEQEHRPLLLHLVPVEREVSEEEVRSFLEDVVRPHPDLELYLAHMGGNGGYRVSAKRVVEAFLAFFAESEEQEQRPIYFEFSAALLTTPTDGVAASRGAEIRALARDLRRLGLQRVLFGSDYPVFDAAEYAQAMQERLPLSTEELTQILDNRGPALLRASESHSAERRHQSLPP